MSTNGIIIRILLVYIVIFFSLNQILNAQCLTLGADLSYVNTIEANSGIYNDENGSTVDPFAYFAQRGCNMARIRLWHTPQNNIDFCGNPVQTNSLADVVLAFQRAKAVGMQLNLAIHYGDYFNDPGKQVRPQAWMGLGHPVLLDSVNAYTYEVLDRLRADDVTPDIVAIGNETTWGFMDETAPTDGWNWPEDADKFNAGLDAVLDFNLDFDADIKTALHFTDGSAEWLAGLFQEQGITDFDIIGISFYPWWTDLTSVEALGELITSLKESYDKEVMIFETAAPWTTEWADNYHNIVGDFGNLDYPVSPAGQRQYLLDLAEVVKSNGGLGVLYWEPAWIISEMCDLWGQGSSWENVALFDFNADNTPLPGFDFFDINNLVNTTNLDIAPSPRIFPNPTKRSFYCVNPEGKYSSWEIRDISGQIISAGKLISELNSIPITFQKPGIYFFVLTGKGESSMVHKIWVYD